MLLSVLVDTYNHERLIEKALRSVLDQDFPREDFEVIVVDDGSTEKTSSDRIRCRRLPVSLERASQPENTRRAFAAHFIGISNTERVRI